MWAWIITISLCVSLYRVAGYMGMERPGAVL